MCTVFENKGMGRCGGVGGEGVEGGRDKAVAMVVGSFCWCVLVTTNTNHINIYWHVNVFCSKGTNKDVGFFLDNEMVLSPSPIIHSFVRSFKMVLFMSFYAVRHANLSFRISEWIEGCKMMPRRASTDICLVMTQPNTDTDILDIEIFLKLIQTF